MVLGFVGIVLCMVGAYVFRPMFCSAFMHHSACSMLAPFISPIGCPVGSYFRSFLALLIILNSCFHDMMRGSSMYV